MCIVQPTESCYRITFTCFSLSEYFFFQFFFHLIFLFHSLFFSLDFYICLCSRASAPSGVLFCFSFRIFNIFCILFSKYFISFYFFILCLFDEKQQIYFVLFALDFYSSYLNVNVFSSFSFVFGFVSFVVVSRHSDLETFAFKREK